MNATFSTINDDACDAYAELGAVCLRDVFTDWVELLRTGVERNHEEPGPYFSENVVGADGGRFWDDIDGQKLREDWFPVLWPRITTN